MEVDLHQLPIPSWNLSCPSCGYCVNGLTSHRCPECGREFDMSVMVPTHARLRDPTFTGEESPLLDFGLRCHSCDRPLIGAEDGLCPHCATAFDPTALLPSEPWFGVPAWMRYGVPVEIVALMLDDAFVPYIARHAQNAFVAGSMQLSVASEFFFDLLYLTRQRSESANRR